ncbi:MAG: hypothetical protein ACI93S_000689, partial [Ancylomarina sp.]
WSTFEEREAKEPLIWSSPNLIRPKVNEADLLPICFILVSTRQRNEKK